MFHMRGQWAAVWLEDNLKLSQRADIQSPQFGSAQRSCIREMLNEMDGGMERDVHARCAQGGAARREGVGEWCVWCESRLVIAQDEDAN